MGEAARSPGSTCGHWDGLVHCDGHCWEPDFGTEQCGAETTPVGQRYLECPSRISHQHSFIQVGGAAFFCAQRGQGWRGNARESTEQCLTMSIWLSKHSLRGWFIDTETMDYCAVSQGPFHWLYSFLQIYELPISYKWSPPVLGCCLLASFLSCFSWRVFLSCNI